MISANIPIASFLDWLAGLGTSLVIEFVGRDDEMVQTLLMQQGRPVFRLQRRETSRRSSRARFDIAESRPLKGGKRKIYFATAR